MRPGRAAAGPCSSTRQHPAPSCTCTAAASSRAHAAAHPRRPALLAAGRGGSSMRRKDMAALPEDGHHSPSEAPEALLLLVREREAAAAAAAAAAAEAAAAGSAEQAAAAAGAGRPAKRKAERMLRLPGTELTLTPELVAISMVYFVQGILGLSRLALSFFFKDDLGVEPAQVAVLTGLAGLPWVVKPLYGFVSDSIPLFGYRRRSYLVLCGLAGTASWLALAGAVRSPSGAVAAMLLGSFSTACSDVVVDSLVVERARGEPAATAGSLQSLCWASSAVGGIASAYFSGSLVQAYGPHTVFALTAVFPLIVSASALLIDEQRVPSGATAGRSHAKLSSSSSGGGGGGGAGLPVVVAAARSSGGSSSSSGSWARVLPERVTSQGLALWDTVRQRHILLPTIFVFLWQATPTADTAMFYFYTNQLHFSPEFLGRVRLAGSVASLAGVALYNSVFKSLPLKRMLLWAMLLGVGLGSTQLLLVSGVNRQLGLSDELFVLGDSVILTVLGQVSFMPILVLAARLCPEGVEATLFATLMSILNGGSFVGSALGAGLTSTLGVTSSDFSNLFLLLALCNASTLLPAPFLWLLPAALDAEPPEGKDKGGGGSDGGGSNGGGGSSSSGKGALVGGGADAEVLQQQAPRPQRRRQQQTAAALGAGADSGAGSVVLPMQALLGGGSSSSSSRGAAVNWGSRSSGGSDDGDGGEQRPLLAPHGPEQPGSKAV